MFGGDEFAAAVERGNNWLAQNGPVTPENFAGLLDAFEQNYPLSSTALVSVVPNLMPLPGLGDASVQNVFVITANRQFHDCEDFADCPPEIFAGMIQASAALSALQPTTTVVPYINGGRHRMSGATVAHPHGQVALLEGIPSLFGKLRYSKQLGTCRICQLVEMGELHIQAPESKSMVLMANPAPEYSFSLLLLARDCVDDLAQVDAFEFARLYIRAIAVLSEILGNTPAYNLAIRVGAGHLHAEIVPRSGVNIKAGAEIAIQEAFVDVSPSQVVRAFNQVLFPKELPR
jgi:hypothetical protein